MKGNVIALLVVAAALYFGRKLFSAGRVSFRIIGANLRKLSLQVELINPTNTPLSVDAFVASLLINNQSFGTLDFRNRITLTATDRQVINIPIRLNPVGGAQLLRQILTGSTSLRNAQIEVDGTLNSENVVIPVKATIPLV